LFKAASFSPCTSSLTRADLPVYRNLPKKNVVYGGLKYADENKPSSNRVLRFLMTCIT
jgi:hypothetical protein